MTRRKVDPVQLSFFLGLALALMSCGDPTYPSKLSHTDKNAVQIVPRRPSFLLVDEDQPPSGSPTAQLVVDIPSDGAFVEGDQVLFDPGNFSGIPVVKMTSTITMGSHSVPINEILEHNGFLFWIEPNGDVMSQYISINFVTLDSAGAQSNQTPSASLSDGATAFFRDTVSSSHTLKVIWSVNPPGKLANQHDPDYSANNCALIILNGGADCVMTMGEIIQSAAPQGGVDIELYHGDPAVLTLIATPQSGDPGNQFKFTVTRTDGQKVRDNDVVAWSWRSEAPRLGRALTSPAPCATSGHACKARIFESGVMTVEVAVNGTSVSAQVRVAVQSCPDVGDSTLDSPESRKQLFDELAASNPDASPESMQRKEHGGFIYQRLDGSRVLVPVVGTAITSQCAYKPDLHALPSVDPTWVKVGEYHTHPSLEYDVAYGCVDKPGEPHNRQFPGDFGFLPTVGRDGASDDDWSYAKNGVVTEYIADKAGNVWRINYPPGATPESNVSTKWRRQTGSVCLKAP